MGAGALDLMVGLANCWFVEGDSTGPLSDRLPMDAPITDGYEEIAGRIHLLWSVGTIISKGIISFCSSPRSYPVTEGFHRSRRHVARQSLSLHLMLLHFTGRLDHLIRIAAILAKIQDVNDLASSVINLIGTTSPKCVRRS